MCAEHRKWNENQRQFVFTRISQGLTLQKFIVLTKSRNK
jgi:hypothetical protein